MAASRSGPGRPRTVLFIDEGVSFGGSLVTTSRLVKYLDPARYRAVVTSEAGEDVLRQRIGDTAACYAFGRAFNYLHWERLRPKIRRLPFRWLRSAAILVLLCLAGVLNTPYYLRLAWLVKREGVDLIHHSNGATHLMQTFLGVPVMAKMAGIKSAKYSLGQRMALNRMRKFVIISEAAREAYVKHGGREEIVEMIPNPCDPQPLSESAQRETRARYGIGADCKVFAILGRIVHWKGQKEFARAALRVLEQVPDACALIVGDAADGGEEYLAAVRAVAEGSPHRDRIRFLGYLPNVHEIYNIMHVAVHASTIPEPFGLVVIEAMGYGVPIVAADSGGPTEIVDDGVDGFLVDPSDAGALSAKIVDLLSNDALHAKMAAAGRAKVAERYDPRVYAERIQKIYDEILG